MWRKLFPGRTAPELRQLIVAPPCARRSSCRNYCLQPQGGEGEEGGRGQQSLAFYITLATASLVLSFEMSRTAASPSSLFRSQAQPHLYSTASSIVCAPDYIKPIPSADLIKYVGVVPRVVLGARRPRLRPAGPKPPCLSCGAGPEVSLHGEHHQRRAVAAG